MRAVPAFHPTGGKSNSGRLRYRLMASVALMLWLAGSSSHAARTFELTTATIADIQAAFAAGALTSEKLTRLYLARIAAYDKQGPALNAILTINPNAELEARVLDEERRKSGPRGPLHGVPVLLKANIEVAGWPATAGFFGLRDSLAASDAEQTKRLRRAGCVILGLTNMSEFASGPAVSTLGGQIRNPYGLDRSPAGSSGGNGAALAASFAAFALGTDTGGSIRGPASANGIAGIRPTAGLNGRGGIIPLALSLDTVGPMALHVADLAAALTIMAGSDERDPSAVTREPVDYTAALNLSALKGARFGIVREFATFDPAWESSVMDAAVATLRRQGAEVVEVAVPRYLLAMFPTIYPTIRDTEFRFQIADYLASLSGPGLPKSHADIIRLSESASAPGSGWTANPARLDQYRREAAVGTLDDQPYRSAVAEGRTIVRDVLQWTLQHERLDAFVGPVVRPARLITDERTPEAPGWRYLAVLAGWPELVVPAGYTENSALPVGLAFLGPAFSEAKLLSFGNAFELAHPVRRVPRSTPALQGERLEY